MNNPAAHVYPLFAPLLLGGALLVKQEWFYGLLIIGITILLIQYVKYYEAIKRNKYIIKSFLIYNLICATTGTLEHLELISFGINYSIFLIMLIYYLFKFNKIVTKIADDKANLNV